MNSRTVSSRAVRWLAAAAATLMGFPAAWSQDEDAVTAVRAVIRDVGKESVAVISGPTREQYLKLHRQAGQSGVEVTRDVSYGPHELQGFDLYVPAEPPAEPMPVVVYLHGGGLVRGDKVVANTDGLMYANITTFFARNGMIGINANYRLVPEIQWPAGAEDVRGILDWIRANVEDYGGDPESVFLMCNSAGCAHAAAYMFHQPLHFEDGSGVAGALLSSGGFGSGNSDYYGENESVRQQRSVVALVDAYEGPQVPIFLWSAELDMTGIELGVAELYMALCNKFRDCPEFTQFLHHNHLSHVQSINSADDTVAKAALDFIQRHR